MIYRGSGKIYARRQWQNILTLEPGSVLRLSFSGTWRVNRNWGEVDFRGNGNYSGTPSYPGPGLPEGCMLVRVDGGKGRYPGGSLPWVFRADDGVAIDLRCNDEDAGLRDNSGHIVFNFEYEAPR